MARGNRAFKSEKRTKELKRLKKQEEKRQRKLAKLDNPEASPRSSRPTKRRPPRPTRTIPDRKRPEAVRATDGIILIRPEAPHGGLRRGRTLIQDRPMRNSVRPAGGALPVLLLPRRRRPRSPDGDGLERTLFKDLPATDPAREIVRTVLDSPSIPCVTGFTAKAWAADGFRDAWERARTYFPGEDLARRPGDPLHGPRLRSGREAVHGGPRVRLPHALRREQADVHGRLHRRRLRPDARPRPTAGRPRPSARRRAGSRPSSATRTAHRALRKALGEDRLRRVPRQALREEDYHMLAGGLMHEGMHAGLDDAVVARLQAEFEAGGAPRPMGRAAGLHGRDRLPRDSTAHGPRPNSARRGAGSARLLRKLESLQEKAAASAPAPDRAGFEKRPGRDRASSRARPPEDAGDLAVGPAHRRGSSRASAQDYVRGRPPAEVEGPLAALEQRRRPLHRRPPARPFRRRELALRDLEDASGPVGRMGGRPTAFPAPGHGFERGRRQARPRRSPGRTRPSTGPAVLMRLAGRGSRAGTGPSRKQAVEAPRPSPRPGSAPASSAGRTTWPSRRRR
ncbi:MAG: hypothetical protein M0C28_32380 [Candidatus Moduliflexus flocculans]|nr:hypothetical protein [Candidatus Moduliflexus flocculans]